MSQSAVPESISTIYIYIVRNFADCNLKEFTRIIPKWNVYRQPAACKGHVVCVSSVSGVSVYESYLIN